MLCRKYPPLKDDKCISGLAQHLCKVKGPQFSSCCAIYVDNDSLIKYFFDLDPFTSTQPMPVIFS